MASGESDQWRVQPLRDMSEDLFTTPEVLPVQIQAILLRYSEEGGSYNHLEAFQKELEAFGYTFDYGLDAVPYDLRKI